MKKIYIAGPYSIGDKLENVHTAIRTANELADIGFAPYCPHALTHYWDQLHPRPYEFWLELDRHFLVCCDAVYRMQGESTGADREVKQAISLGIPIFHTIEAMCEHFELTPDH